MTLKKFEVKGQRSPQGQMSRSHGHYITSSRDHCITLQISYCPESRLAPVFSILVPDPYRWQYKTWLACQIQYHTVNEAAVYSPLHVYVSIGMGRMIVSLMLLIRTHAIYAQCQLMPINTNQNSGSDLKYFSILINAKKWLAMICIDLYWNQ